MTSSFTLAVWAMVNFAANRLILLKYRYDLDVSCYPIPSKGRSSSLVLVLLLQLNLVEVAVVEDTGSLGCRSRPLSGLAQGSLLRLLLSDSSSLLGSLCMRTLARRCGRGVVCDVLGLHHQHCRPHGLYRSRGESHRPIAKKLSVPCESPRLRDSQRRWRTRAAGQSERAWDPSSGTA